MKINIIKWRLCFLALLLWPAIIVFNVQLALYIQGISTDEYTVSVNAVTDISRYIVFGSTIVFLIGLIVTWMYNLELSKALKFWSGVIEKVLFDQIVGVLVFCVLTLMLSVYEITYDFETMLIIYCILIPLNVREAYKKQRLSHDF